MENLDVEKGVFAEFHKNSNLHENYNFCINLDGILRLILIKHISFFITDVNQINSIKIKKIITKLKKSIKPKESDQRDIKLNLEEKSGLNILAYSNYINSIITDKVLKDCLKYIEPEQKNEVLNYWSILSYYQSFNKLFEIEILKANERSYFDYSLIGLSMYESNNRKNFIEAMNKCPNVVVKYLFNGHNTDDISKIMIQNHFDYPKKALYGMGIYFTDMLDYIAFSAFRRGSLEYNCPINETFSCVSAEIYHSQLKQRNIYDCSLAIKELDHSPTYENKGML